MPYTRRNFLAAAAATTFGLTVGCQPIGGPVISCTSSSAPPKPLTHGEALTTSLVGFTGLGRVATDLVKVDPNGWRISTWPGWGKPPWIPNRPYVYNNSPSNHGGIVPAGGMTIDGYRVPAGAWVSQFHDYTDSLYAEGDAGGEAPPWPGMVFRGCRMRFPMDGTGFVNDWASGNPMSSIGRGWWFLYCNAGGPSPNSSGDTAVVFKPYNPTVFLRNYISWTATGIQPNLRGPVDIVENYIERLTMFQPSYHLNGIEFNGDTSGAFRVLRNYVVGQTPDDAGHTVDQTTCVGFGLDTFTYPGGGTNLDGSRGYFIRNNYVGGTGYCFYAAGNRGSGLTFTGNKVTTRWWPNGGYYGAITDAPIWGHNANVQSGNTWATGPNSGKSFI